METNRCIKCGQILEEGIFCAYCGHDRRKGITLREYIGGRGGKLTPEETFRILSPVMQFLEQEHAAGRIHCGINPDSITLGVGAAPAINPPAGGEGLRTSYAPVELYQDNGVPGPWTDVYSMCATAYTCLTGKNPPNVTDRMMGSADFDWAIPGLDPMQATALRQGSAIDPNDRFRSMAVLHRAIFGAAAPAAAAPVQRPAGISLRKDGDPVPAPAAAPAQRPTGISLRKDGDPIPVPHAVPRQPYSAAAPQPVPPQPVPTAPAAQRSNPWKVILPVVLAVVLVAILAVWLLGRSDNGAIPAAPIANPPAAKAPVFDSPVETMAMQVGITDNKVAIFRYTDYDTFMTTVSDCMEHDLIARGANVTNYYADLNQDMQLEQIHVAVAEGASLLLVSMVDPSNDEYAACIVDLAAEADIPVVFFIRTPSPAAISHYSNAYIVTNDYNIPGLVQGEMIAEYLLTNYDQVDSNADGVISYVMLKGQEGNLVADSRTENCVFQITLTMEDMGYGSLSFYDPSNVNGYLADPNGSWSPVGGYDLVSQAIDSGNTVELVIANNDGMATGAVMALQERGYNLPGCPYIPVFGIDGTADAMELIDSMAMTGTVYQDPQEIAAAMVQISDNVLSEKDPFWNVGGSQGNRQTMYLNYKTYTG